MQIPILAGIFADESADFRSSMPHNMVPVPKSTGISEGYLRPSDGLVKLTDGPGIGRGGINWNSVLHRVMGGKLVRINAAGASTSLADIAGIDQARLDYSFDRLSISAGGNLYYWNGAALTQVTDPDLGTVIDHLWVDGYFMFTDGKVIGVTELNDPTSVNPLKYGSSEADPDPIVALLKLRNEVTALNRYTCETFDNVGGDLFPFARIEGAQLERGCIGTHACAVYMENICFLGGNKKESPGIFIGAGGSTLKISTREIDTILQRYTEGQLSLAIMEVKSDLSHEHLYLHLPDMTLLYDGAASKEVGRPVWFYLTSGLAQEGQYRAHNFIWCYDQWNVTDPQSPTIGKVDLSISTHYGQKIGWDFGTAIIYNEGYGAQFHQLELVSLPGRIPLGADPVIWTSYSIDGETWSMEKPCSAGRQGDRTKRLTWLKQGSMRNWRIQKFRGTSDAHLSVARLEAKIEALNG